ncbi:helix-hairpin-helix domain-containing protein (plasmid) [Streptomyces sp. NBC_01220]|uniref:DNA polymerase Y family protein n=1 Tax=Streptomyces sp. NBC_01220 TaxID=2903781 RepID=UPI002F914FC0|nr:helix-hairpin-helix domain-containing protein [Streptomyces sp. NBC_01220]
MTTSPRTIMRIHFHVAEPAEGLYDQLLAVLDTITPRIEPHPADWSADLDLTGALRYWARDPAALVGVIRLRVLALHGVQSSAGAGPNRMIAAMAAAVTPPGTATLISNSPYEIASFLRPQPAAALPGIGPATAKTLARYGIHTVGDIADTPLATLQRILGAPARQAHERAHGRDERTVTPAVAPRSISTTHPYDRDELDSARHHAALLGLTDELGARLREEHSIAQALTLTVTYADRTSTTRTRTLTEPTAHTPQLGHTSLELLARLGLQRARVRTISLRAERLLPAEQAAHQLTLDTRDDKARNLEAALDRARARYGPGIATTAAAGGHALPPRRPR